MGLFTAKVIHPTHEEKIIYGLIWTIIDIGRPPEGIIDENDMNARAEEVADAISDTLHLSFKYVEKPAINAKYLRDALGDEYKESGFILDEFIKDYWKKTGWYH